MSWPPHLQIFSASHCPNTSAASSENSPDSPPKIARLSGSHYIEDEHGDEYLAAMRDAGIFSHHTVCLACGNFKNIEHRANWRRCPGPCPFCSVSHSGQPCPQLLRFGNIQWWMARTGRTMAEEAAAYRSSEGASGHGGSSGLSREEPQGLSLQAESAQVEIMLQQLGQVESKLDTIEQYMERQQGKLEAIEHHMQRQQAKLEAIEQHMQRQEKTLDAMMRLLKTSHSKKAKATEQMGSQELAENEEGEKAPTLLRQPRSFPSTRSQMSGSDAHGGIAVLIARERQTQQRQPGSSASLTDEGIRDEKKGIVRAWVQDLDTHLVIGAAPE